MRSVLRLLDWTRDRLFLWRAKCCRCGHRRVGFARGMDFGCCMEAIMDQTIMDLEVALDTAVEEWRKSRQKFVDVGGGRLAGNLEEK